MEYKTAPTMMLNSGLFWELCKEYGIPLSKNYECLMLEDNYGELRELRDEDINRIFEAKVKRHEAQGGNAK